MRSPAQSSDSVLGAGNKKGSCRLCGTSLRLAVDFGRMPLANAFLKAERFSSEYFFNLSAGFCEPCTLLQLMEQPDPGLMFHSTYPFFSGSSEFMKKHFAELAQSLQKEWFPQGAFVVEIGSNDGTMLQNFPAPKYQCLGIEPSLNTAARARELGIETLPEFFNASLADQVKKTHASADIFIGTNVLCHIPDLNGTLQGIQHLLSPDGIAVFEDPYLGDVLTKTSYDQIYDEHVYLFSVTSLKKLFERQGLRLFDVHPLWTHGGSLRYFVCKKDSTHTNTMRVNEFLEKEKQSGMLDYTRYQTFRKQCEHSRDLLRETLNALKSAGKRVAGYGATSKSTTVLNYCGINSELVEFISDTTPEKQGKFSPGVHIPILPYDHFQTNYPSHALLFAWNHAEEIRGKEKAFERSGGHWITYVPEVRIS